MENQLSPNSVRTYHLAPEGFAAARNKLVRQKAVLFAGIVVFLLVFQYKQFQDWRGDSIASLIPAVVVIVIIFSALAVGVKKGTKLNQEAWNSYELLIGEDFLIRRMKDFPELEIQRHEVTAIKESATGLSVETHLKDRTIGIAFALVDYEDAKVRLSRWMLPVQVSQQGWMTPTRLMWVLPMLTGIFFACFIMTTSSWAIVATGVPLLIGLSWSMWRIRKSLQVSAQMKRLSLMTALPLMAIVVKLIQAIIKWR